MKTLWTLMCVASVVFAAMAAGCVADVPGEDGAASEDITEAQELLGYNCDGACHAAQLIHWALCNNDRFVNRALRPKCMKATREASNACFFVPPDEGCQTACMASHVRFAAFCPEVPEKKRYHCRERNAEALAACVAKGSAAFTR